MRIDAPAVLGPPTLRRFEWQRQQAHQSSVEQAEVTALSRAFEPGLGSNSERLVQPPGADPSNGPCRG
jgi:hypothetical protein